MPGWDNNYRITMLVGFAILFGFDQMLFSVTRQCDTCLMH